MFTCHVHSPHINSSTQCEHIIDVYVFDSEVTYIHMYMYMYIRTYLLRDIPGSVVVLTNKCKGIGLHTTNCSGNDLMTFRPAQSGRNIIRLFVV